jgi:hypothetical protein
MRTILLVASLLAAVTSAHAERVGVVVTGEAILQPVVVAQLETWLRDHGRTVVPSSMPPEAISTLMDCFVLEDLGCARGVVDARAKSPAVVFARIDAQRTDDGSREISLTAYWFTKGHESQSARRVCKQCSDSALGTAVDDLMVGLAAPPLPRAAARNDAVRPISTADETSAATETGEMPRYLAPTLIGVGAAALLGGIVMIAIDEDPPPIGPQPPTLRDTATGGVVLGAIGVVALGAGAYLWWKRSRSSPVAALTPDGGYVGWVGRF